MADENKTPGVIDAENSGADPKTDDTQATEDKKEYTQAEIDAMIESAKAAQKKKILPPKEEMDAFRAWKAEQEKNKPADEKSAQVLQENQTLKAKLQAYENKEKVLNKGVNPSFADYVSFEVSKRMDDHTDFEDSLDAFLKANQQYKVVSTGDPAPAAGMRHTGAPEKTTGVEEAFYAKNPNLRPK